MEFAVTICFLVFLTLTTLPEFSKAHGKKLTPLENKLLTMLVECKSCNGQPGSYLGKNRPAFTAILTKTTTLSTKSNKILKFDKVILNQGGGYNPKSGIFTAPRKGLYHFSVTVLSDNGKDLNLQLVRNGSALLNLYGPAIHGGSETANPILDLKEGEKVSVEINPDVNADQIIHGNTYTYFSGYYI